MKQNYIMQKLKLLLMGDAGFEAENSMDQLNDENANYY
jgi:hypothetical protein